MIIFKDEILDNYERITVEKRGNALRFTVYYADGSVPITVDRDYYEEWLTLILSFADKRLTPPTWWALKHAFKFFNYEQEASHD